MRKASVVPGNCHRSIISAPSDIPVLLHTKEAHHPNWTTYSSPTMARSSAWHRPALQSGLAFSPALCFPHAVIPRTSFYHPSQYCGFHRAMGSLCCTKLQQTTCHFVCRKKKKKKTSKPGCEFRAVVGVTHGM